MPAHRMNMRMIKDVLRLKFDGGFSHDRIAASLGISKGVVTKYVGLAGAAGLDWASACDMDEGELERRLLGKPTGPGAYAQPDYGRIHQELRRKGRDTDAAVGGVPGRVCGSADLPLYAVL